MAVGPSIFPDMPVIEGVRIGVASAGIKTPGRRDLIIFELCEGTQVAGTFTRNSFCAAPVTLAKGHMAEAATRYWLINTGNANAGTGEAGMQAAQTCCDALATRAGVAANQVLPYSTGVIGEPLPTQKITDVLDEVLASCAPDRWADAAQGILTTDTRPKGATRTVMIQGQPVIINGISKGSGMICPNMATMLAFVATDAAITQPVLQALLSETTEHSFNRITVDSDTSTNDACMLAATGVGVEIKHDADIATFKQALQEVMLELAQAIIRDGEGATKFVTVSVRDACDEAEALKVAYSVAHSPLVKTALFACDANWGRLLMAVGKAGVEALDVSNVTLSLNGLCIAEHGARANGYTEAAGSRVMAEEEITIDIALGRGEAATRVWTSDLSHDYVTINAEYRT